MTPRCRAKGPSRRASHTTTPLRPARCYPSPTGDATTLRERPVATPCDRGMQAAPRHHPAPHDATQLNGRAPPRCHDVAQKARRRFILAAPNSFYLDCGAGGWVGNNPGRNSWCEPFKTWQNAYTFDPLANLTAAHRRSCSVGSSSSGQNSPARRTLTLLSGPAQPRPRRNRKVPRVRPGQSRRRLRSRSEAETWRTASSWVLNCNLTLSNDTIALVWISSDDTTAVAAKDSPCDRGMQAPPRHRPAPHEATPAQRASPTTMPRRRANCPTTPPVLRLATAIT
ncbi:hypothetical protein EDB83DRAFT_2520306 [Lactarius deliciosus]|nr:hypothetical protein EDB83DRAFT_2520306 [Lactarius deliciosus]